MPRGREAAEAQRKKLAALGLSDEAYRDYVASLTPRPGTGAPIVHFLRIENDSAVADATIRDRLRQPVGAPLDRAQLEKDIAAIYGLELFQNVRYDLVEENGKTGLLVSANARRWGPNYLQMGVRLSSDAEGNSNYNLGIGYLRTAINPLNGEIRIGLQVGEEPLIAGEWYQPLDTLARYFVHTRLRYGARNVAAYMDTDRVAEFRVTEALGDLAAGRELGTFGEARLGYRYCTGDIKLQTGTLDVPEPDYVTAQVYGRLSVDTLDTYNFPERGWSGALEYASARGDFGSDTHFDQISARAARFTTLTNGHVVGLAGLVTTTIDGTAGIQDRYRLGGFLNLSGYAEDSLSGQQAGVLAALYYRRFKPLRFLSWYAGGSLEYGGVWEDKDDIGEDGIAAGSLFLGADTPIGPLYLG